MLDAGRSETLLEVNNIEVIYNHVILVLKGVAWRSAERGITALLGGNGAGKTTTLKAISNLLALGAGRDHQGAGRSIAARTWARSRRPISCAAASSR